MPDGGLSNMQISIAALKRSRFNNVYEVCVCVCDFVIVIVCCCIVLNISDFDMP